ncbi:MAG TPA: hypothetical protein VNW54_05030 [Granulicella sp.]|nr:hypothetical protein [Granulicella sp.]
MSPCWAYTTQTTAFETAVPWMYLDTRAFVTAGIGQMLPDVASARALAFVAPDGSAATPDDISADFLRIQALPQGENFHAYRSDTSPALTDGTMTAPLTTVISANDAVLRTRLPGVRRIPRPRQTGPARHDLQPRRIQALRRIPPCSQPSTTSTGSQPPSNATATAPTSSATTGPATSS